MRLLPASLATPPAPPVGMVTTSIDQLVVDPDALPADRPAAPRGLAMVLARATVGSAPQVHGTARPGAQPSIRDIRGGVPPSEDEPSVGPAASPEPALEESTEPSATPAVPPASAPTPRRSILAFGESVMIQGAEALAEDLGPVRVDAAVGRHINEGIEILEQRADHGKLASVVIVQLGNNGPFRAGQFDAVMAPLSEVPLVVWVNVRVPRDWEAHNNRIIASGIEKYPNARLVDWHGATAGHPELFWKDGYHPRPKGAELYADLIAAAVR